MPRYFTLISNLLLVPPRRYTVTEKCSRITMTAIIISNIFNTIVVITALFLFILRGSFLVFGCLCRFNNFVYRYLTALFGQRRQVFQA